MNARLARTRLPIPQPMKDLLIRKADEFWKRVDKTGDCWLWTGSLNTAGFGQVGRQINHKASMFLAHRVAYFLSRGDIPEGHDIRRTCRNKLCCNPKHLFAKKCSTWQKSA